MDDEQEKAFAAFDQHKADLAVLHGHATRIGDAALVTALDVHHTRLQETWAEYLERRGWSSDANTANRSGGENKGTPPGDQPEEP